MKMIKNYLTIIFLLCWMSIYAQNRSFELVLSEDTILLGNYVVVDFVINNTEGNFEAPDFGAFDIIGGPNISTSFQFLNGVSSQKKIYSYYIKPRDIGAYIIAPAFLEAEGQFLETSPIEIIVLPNPDQIMSSPTKKVNPLFNDWKITSPFDIKKEEPKKKDKPSKWKKRKI